LQAHPTVRQDLISHPERFMGREDQLNNYRYGGGGNNGAVDRFDTGYLDEHPEVSQQLARNPGLADNPQYLAAHPGLNDYLQAHPTVRQDLISHPDRFMGKEDQLNGRPGPYAEEGFHSPNAYHPAGGYSDPNFAAEHPFAASHPNAAAHYWHHHHQQ
jgi:hypothetical protein